MCEDCLISRREAAGLVKMLRERVDSEARRVLVEHLVWTLKDASGNVDCDLSAEEADRILWEINPGVSPEGLSEGEWGRLERLAAAGIDADALSIFAGTEFEKDVHRSTVKRTLDGMEQAEAE